MYSPAAFSLDSPSEILTLLRSIGFGHLVTQDPSSGLDATSVPFLVDDDLRFARAHVAKMNDQWKALDGSEALLIVPGSDAYVSPRWYPSKAEHGRVVPTWNYEVVHLHGMVSVRHEPDWKLDIVSDLTDHHEPRVDDPERAEPWAVGDAPDEFIATQLRAIVGIELRITRIDAKRKLSQNRSDADRAGVTAGLGRSRRTNDE